MTKAKRLEMRKKQYEDVIENSEPFWFVRCTTKYYKRVLCCACLFYIAMIVVCVSFNLLNLAEIMDEDFEVAGSEASNAEKMSLRWTPERLRPFINITDAM